MYNLKDYLNRGVLLLNNNLFPSNKKLSTIMLYTTDLCNARCNHCFIWEKKPKQTLSFDNIKKIVNSKVVTKNTLIGLEGGEFILHPEHEEIIKYLKENHPNFDLLSNCVNVERLVEIVKKYTPKRLYISLDGKESTHEEIRGVKNLFNKVIEVIDNLNAVVPISVMFTLTPFNNFEDLQFVSDICKDKKIDLRIGIYNNMEYFDTKENALESKTLDYEIKDIPEDAKFFDENYDFVALYTYFRKKEIKLPCYSIKDSIVIYPNGDIPICQNKGNILGNITKESLDKIIRKKSTLKTLKANKNCNACWINFHRKYDVVLLRSLEKFLPKSVIQLFFGKYSWCADSSKKYKALIK